MSEVTLATLRRSTARFVGVVGPSGRLHRPTVSSNRPRSSVVSAICRKDVRKGVREDARKCVRRGVRRGVCNAITSVRI